MLAVAELCLPEFELVAEERESSLELLELAVELELERESLFPVELSPLPVGTLGTVTVTVLPVD